MNILSIQGTESGLYYHRQLVPHRVWHESGDEFKKDIVVVIPLHKLTPDLLHAALDKYRFDIVQFSIAAPVPTGMQQMWGFFKAIGAKVVLDIDDRYNFKEKLETSILWPHLSAITTTNRFLGQHIYKYFKIHPHVIENGIDMKEEQWTPTPHPDGDIVFGYMGSTRHEDDIKYMNYDFSDLHLYAACESYNDIVNISSFDPLGGWEDYAKKYDKIDVSLAPLVPTAHNRSKSLLKIIEAGAKKRAIICSETDPYTRDPELMPFVKYVRCGNSWESAVKAISKDESIELGEKLYQAVQKYEIRNVNKTRRAVYKRIIKSK